uniref:Autophagy protein 5 n=1 Tax=Panagrolaimus sp. ES5 TaxID=591445 RepID=A0AC34F8G6_9BILA
MADDYEVKRTIWDGKVPVEFVLDSSEFVVRSSQSYFIMLPRVSYFPICLGKVLQFFKNNIDEIDDVKNVWLQTSGKMLKWHYPIGVLHDLYSSDASLPWVVTIRFQTFPDDLVKCGTIDLMRHYFIQTVKEADQLKHKGAIMSAMKSEEHAQLFNGICNDKFDDFWSVNKKLMDTNEAKLLYIPMRFYLPDTPFRQVLISPHKEDDKTPQEPTLKSALQKACPDINPSGYVIISHGINVPLESPVYWLSKNFCYPDNFVHLVLRHKSDENY